MSGNLPVKKTDEFLAEVEVMDLSPLKDKSFIVGISTGDRSKVQALSSSLHGPYNFYEMVDEVAYMWNTHQHHAKVLIVSKDRSAPVLNLDENTVDYIEAHYSDIITDAVLEGAFDEKDFTCQAGIVADTEADTAATLPKANDTKALPAPATVQVEGEEDDL